jgi:hypothetical protein
MKFDEECVKELRLVSCDGVLEGLTFVLELYAKKHRLRLWLKKRGG